MPTCLSCGANLSPEWKYCIYCGALAATVSPRRQSARTGRADAVALAIPPAIRPGEPAVKSRTKLDVPLLLGIVLGVAGVALIVYMAILVFGPK